MCELNLRLGFEKRVLDASSMRNEEWCLHTNNIQFLFENLEELSAAKVNGLHFEEEIVLLN